MAVRWPLRLGSMDRRACPAPLDGRLDGAREPCPVSAGRSPSARRPPRSSLAAHLQPRRDHVLDGVDLTVAPGHRIGVVGPNGVGKTTLLAGPGRPARPGPRLGAARAAGRDGRLPAPGARAPAGRDGLRAPGPTHGRGRGQRRAGRAPPTRAGRRPTGGADDRYAAALERWLSLGGADLEARAGEVWADLGLPASLLVATDRDAVGRAGGSGRAGCDPAEPLRRLPPRRADQRPRPRRPRAAGARS